MQAITTIGLDIATGWLSAHARCDRTFLNVFESLSSVGRR
jgi:hypothetical protein